MAPRSDTIVALSSAPGRAGVAVVRLSGPSTLHVGQLVAGRLPPPRQAGLRRIRDPETGELLDRALVLVFPGPSSFTGEDVVELHIHGSIAVQRAAIAALTRIEGVRLAEPGEFTRRAWLNGRMGLLDVEAVSDLLVAETEEQRRLALRSRRRFEAHAQAWREQLLNLRAMAEAEIDFSDEDDVVSRLDSDSEQFIDSLLRQLEDALKTYRVAERIRAGLRVAILGPPNAGKSSLLNALVKRDVAITSPIPGTTRDAIEAHVDLDGVAVCFVDTAGIRKADDGIETEGIVRSWRSAESADVTIWLSPADHPVASPDDRFVTVISKSDLVATSERALSVSTLAPGGLDDLIVTLKKCVSEGPERISGEIFLSSERQAAEVRAALSALRRAKSVARCHSELRAEEFRAAVHALDSLIGRIAVEDVLGEVFSRFCIGK